MENKLSVSILSDIVKRLYKNAITYKFNSRRVSVIKRENDYGIQHFRTSKMVMRVINLLNAIKPPNAHRNCYPLFFLFFSSYKY